MIMILRNLIRRDKYKQFKKIKENVNLPATLEDLITFILVEREKIRAIDKLNLAQKFHPISYEEACEALHIANTGV